VFLKGLRFIDLDDVVASYDSDAVYEGLLFLLTIFLNQGKDVDELLEIVSEFSFYPYISKNYNYTYAANLVILSFSYLIPESLLEKIPIQLIYASPLKAISTFVEIISPPEKEESYSLVLLIPELFKLGMYKETLRVLELAEEHSEEFIKGTEIELIAAMSRFFAGKWSREETAGFLKSRETDFASLLEGEFDNLIRLVKGEKAKDVKRPLALLYYYPYSEEVYKDAGILFDYAVRRVPW